MTASVGPRLRLALPAVCASLWTAGAGVSWAQVTITPDTAPPALLNVQSLAIDASGGDQFDPHVDGNLIAYVRTSGSAQAIWYFRVGVDSTPQQVPPAANTSDLLPHTFGTRVTFSRVISDRTAVMVFDTAQPASSTNPFEIDPTPSVYRFSAAIGGSTVAYIDTSLAAGGELVAYDLTANSVIRLTTDTAIDANPKVSPDGNVIVWQRCPVSLTACDIWKAVKSNGAWTTSVVSSDPSQEEFPDTTGSVIVYDSDRPAGAGDVFFRDSGGNESQVLVPGIQINPNVAGDFVAFESRAIAGAPGDILLYQFSTHRLWNLTNTTGLNAELDDVTVLPTGELIVVYDSDEFGATARTVHALRFSVPAPAAVSYNVCPLYDATKARKSGSTIPIQIQLCDASGSNLSSPSIVVHAVGVTQVSTSAPGVLADAGNANPDFDFRYDSTIGGYTFNLKTTGYATGTYSLSFTAGSDPVMHAVLFEIR